MTTLGNISLLDRAMLGFLCSRFTRSAVILPCLDWAVANGQGDTPIMSTFHSEMEQAVLDMLITGNCPIILILGRSLYKAIPQKLMPLLDSGRLLIVSLNNQKRITRESAYECNKYICEHASEITFGYLSPESSLNTLYQEALANHKSVTVITQH